MTCPSRRGLTPRDRKVLGIGRDGDPIEYARRRSIAFELVFYTWRRREMKVEFDGVVAVRRDVFRNKTIIETDSLTAANIANAIDRELKALSVKKAEAVVEATQAADDVEPLPGEPATTSDPLAGLGLSEDSSLGAEGEEKTDGE